MNLISKTSVGSKIFKDNNIEFFAGFNEYDDIKKNKELNNSEKEIIDICFFGRSNVGKSSLINSLCFGKKLAYTSKKPGCTRSINFYKFNNNKNLFIVDLPGYGYAKMSKDDAKKINFIIESYILKRKELRKIYLLIDSKTGIHENDANFIRFFEKNEINYSLVLTKIDKISNSNLIELQKLILEVLSKMRFFDNSISLISSKDNIGLDKLRAKIFNEL